MKTLWSPKKLYDLYVKDVFGSSLAEKLFLIIIIIFLKIIIKGTREKGTLVISLLKINSEELEVQDGRRMEAPTKQYL